MSSEALAWAFKQDCPSSSVKFTLVALCECANYKTGSIHPSVAHITEITGQNRKTIIANIAELERLGFISDTGERTGATRQIKVYQANLGTVPKTEQSQERNSTEKVSEESQKRDTEPSRTFIDKAKALPIVRAKPVDEYPKPEWADPIVWSDFLKNRKKKNKPNTATAYKRFCDDIARLSSDEWPPGRLLAHAASEGWAGIYEPRESHNGQSGNQTDGMGRTGRAIERLKREISGGALGSRTGNGSNAPLPTGPRTGFIEAEPDLVLSLGYDRR